MISTPSPECSRSHGQDPQVRPHLNETKQIRSRDCDGAARIHSGDSLGKPRPCCLAEGLVQQQQEQECIIPRLTRQTLDDINERKASEHRKNLSQHRTSPFARSIPLVDTRRYVRPGQQQLLPAPHASLISLLRPFPCAVDAFSSCDVPYLVKESRNRSASDSRNNETRWCAKVREMQAQHRQCVHGRRIVEAVLLVLQ